MLESDPQLFSDLGIDVLESKLSWLKSLVKRSRVLHFISHQRVSLN